MRVLVAGGAGFIGSHVIDQAIGDVEILHPPGRTGDLSAIRVSGVGAAAELGWRATTPFTDGARRYVSWHMLDAEAVEVN